MIWHEIATEIDKINNQVIREEKNLEFEEEPLTIYGKKYFWSKKVPLYGKGKKINGVLGISFDITERKKEQEELLKALKSKSSFLSIMSHELKNTVGNVISSIDIIKSMVNQPDFSKEKLDKFISVGEESAKKVIPFLESVITYFELDSKNLSAAECNLPKVYFELNALPNALIIDNLNLYKVLLIVLDNAIKYTQDGKIFIRAYLEQGYLYIEIEDTGIGMSREHLNNLFMAFSDTEHEDVHYRKFGLQLSIAKKILTLIGGDIVITSVLDKGTKVLLHVPYQESVQEIHNLSDVNMTSIEMPQRILLVEDDINSLQIELSLLQSLGLNVDTASNGHNALKLVGENKYDLIFMDITLPDISGVETAQTIWQKHDKAIPIVAVTSHSSEEAVDDLLEKGFFFIIPKPISLEHFKQFFSSLPMLQKGD
jgi:CheY-like chemotaxis protein